MFTLKSAGFSQGEILDKYGIKSDICTLDIPQLSLPLHWEGAPNETVSYAIVFQDYDNIPDEGVCWIHWLICDIPSSINELEQNASRANNTLVQGTNSWICPMGNYGLPQDMLEHYGGPAPERTHEYEVSIYALDIYLGLKQGFFYNELRKKMEGHILAEAVLKGIYII